MITEEQKQEADRIVEKYIPYSHGHNDATSYHYATHCAVQDRQSVLDEVYYMRDLNNRQSSVVEKRIQSLTNQLEYLKSKL